MVEFGSCPQLSAYWKEGNPPLRVNIGSLSVYLEDLRGVTFALLSSSSSANVQRIFPLVSSGVSTDKHSYLSYGDDEDVFLIRMCDEHAFQCIESVQAA